MENIKPEAERFWIWEANAHGSGTLGVRVAPTGKLSWGYQYRHDGTSKTMTLGRYPEMTVAEAHAAYANAAALKESGVDPGAKVVEQRRADRTAITVAELVDDYAEKYASRKRSGDRDKALLHRNVVPFVGTRKATTLKSVDIVDLLDRCMARGAETQANRTRSVLSRMFNWAEERGYVEANPVTKVKAPGKEKARERVLTDTELDKVLKALPDAKMYEATRLALRWQLLTAARPGEVTGARWDEIDEVEFVWTIPGTRTKNGNSHALPLSPQALEVLKAAKALDRGAGYLFPSPQHEKQGPLDVGALVHGIGRNLDKFGVAKFTAHDLRRTVATGLQGQGASWEVVQRVLNHTMQGETAKYAKHKYLAEMRVALNAWGAKLARLEAAGAVELVREKEGA